MRLVFGGIELINFRSFSGKHFFNFDRPAGLYFVSGQNMVSPAIGPNGVGKSTLFVDAPLWCMTGKVTRSERPAGAVVSWRRDKAFARVALFVAVDGVEHIIERTRNPNALLLDGADVEQGVIDSLLGMNEAQLRRTIFVPQFGDLFLDLRPEQQAQMFTDILQLDVWIKAAKQASDAETALVQRQGAIEMQIEVHHKVDAQLDDQLGKARHQCTQLEDTTDARLAAIDCEVKEARAALKEIEPAGPDVTDDDEHETHERAIDDLLVQVTQYRDARSTASIARAQHEKIIDDIERQIDAYHSDARRCPECGSVVSKEHVAEKRAALERRLPAEQKAHDEASATEYDLSLKLKLLAKEIEDRKSVLREIRSSALAIQRQREDRIHEYTKHVATLEHLVREYEELENAVNPYAIQVKDLLARKQRVDADLAAKSIELNEVLRDCRANRYWHDAFKEIRLSVIDDALDELEVATNAVVQAMSLEDWEIRFETERETKSKTIQNKFTAEIYPPNAKLPVPYEAYCGGEVQRWQMAVTFGLSSVLLARAGIDTNIECLDEPTAHLSAEGIGDLLAYLSERARSLNRAIYLVDHRSLDKGCFDGEVTVIKTVDGSRLA